MRKASSYLGEQFDAFQTPLHQQVQEEGRLLLVETDRQGERRKLQEFRNSRTLSIAGCRDVGFWSLTQSGGSSDLIHWV